MSVNRQDLIDRIESLTDEEIERVGPYLEADLDALVDIDELRNEVALGRESARTEPLINDADVVKSVLARLAREA